MNFNFSKKKATYDPFSLGIRHTSVSVISRDEDEPYHLPDWYDPCSKSREQAALILTLKCLQMTPNMLYYPFGTLLESSIFDPKSVPEV